MPKKPPKNGFFYFMLSYKRRAESNGKTFAGGLAEVAAAASPEWSTLPQFRKDYYNALAKEKKNDPRPNIPKRDEKRFNSQGVSFAEIKLEKVRAEERRNQERDFISNFVHEMNLNDLRDKLIYMIHVNIFCKTDKNVYYPAEIGMVKFSLKGGIKGVFHRYIDPGDIAPGYSFEVKDHSERTHKLTPQFVRSVDGTSDFSRLYRELCQFLTEDEVKSEGSMPPLFTMYDNIFLNSSLDAVKGTFRSLWAHEHPSDDPADNNWESVFRVFPLPDMFFHLKNRCMAVTNPQTIAFPNDVLAKAQLQKDTYHYELDTACKFHRDEDIIAHCSQSFVLRWMYIIRDHCADLIGVDLFPKYIPPKTEIKEEDEYREYDTASMADSQYSKWSETSRSTSDWGIKHERDWSPEGKVKREDERDYWGKCAVKREWDRYSPERCVKRERDRYSPERRVKRERDYSPDRRVKQERDRYSPDDRVKRETDRYSDDRVKLERDWYSDGRVKRETDRYSDDRVKPERGRSPERMKRERDVDGYSSPVKQERSVSGTSVRKVDPYCIKPENGSSDLLYEGTFKCERVDAAGSMKKERNAEPLAWDSIKPERETPGHAEPASMKREKNADFIKQEKMTKPEKYSDWIAEEKPGRAVKDEDLVKNEDVDLEIIDDRFKVETVDLTYSDW